MEERLVSLDFIDCPYQDAIFQCTPKDLSEFKHDEAISADVNASLCQLISVKQTGASDTVTRVSRRTRSPKPPGTRRDIPRHSVVSVILLTPFAHFSQVSPH